jgi:hypothetical protein
MEIQVISKNRTLEAVSSILISSTAESLTFWKKVQRAGGAVAPNVCAPSGPRLGHLGPRRARAEAGGGLGTSDRARNQSQLGSLSADNMGAAQPTVNGAVTLRSPT